jgi:hypothetical protein
LDDGRNVLSRNVTIRAASTIKNSTKWGTKKQPCNHPIHSSGIAGCGGVVAATVNVAINTDDNLIVSQVLRGQIHVLHKALNIDIAPQKYLLQLL